MRRWRKRATVLADFAERAAAYREARRTAYSQAVAKLQQGATAAATTLLKVMLDQSTPASVKVRAAECVMNHSSKAIEIEDVEFRVSELERPAILISALTSDRVLDLVTGQEGVVIDAAWG